MNVGDYPKTIEKKEQYTAGDIAVLYGVSHRTACRLIDVGEIKGFRIPRSSERRVLHDSIVEHVQANPQYSFVLNKIVTKEPE